MTRKIEKDKPEVIYHIYKSKVNSDDWYVVPSDVVFMFIRKYQNSVESMGCVPALFGESYDQNY